MENTQQLVINNNASITHKLVNMLELDTSEDACMIS